MRVVSVITGRGRFAVLATGVVYGDIGTSPLYTLNAVFNEGGHPIATDPAHILGVLSLIFWSLMIVVSIKYVVFVMRADNQGEGGIMALMALAQRSLQSHSRLGGGVLTLGILGAALFYADSAITPAISVLSAVEGLEVVHQDLKPFVVPATLVILWFLFAFQRRGTAGIGRWFGPIMVLWFLTLAALGVIGIARAPGILSALNPIYAAAFIGESPWAGFLSLGGVVLAVTGAEALYADMGHFGRFPIQLAWFVLVLPALVLNYFGQGALMLTHAGQMTNPFFQLAPAWALFALVGLSTAATVIASQAVISGAFSITRQGMQLGYIPRLNILQTSHDQQGQIFIPVINWILLLAVIVLVLGFQSSSNLATAYGIAVTGTMVITSALALIVVSRLWHLGWVKAILLVLMFIVVDLAFFAANLVKIEEGGWLPLSTAVTLFVLMTTWKQGRDWLRLKLQQDALNVCDFAAALGHEQVTRVAGTGVFLTSNPDGVPHALLHNLKHNKICHEHVVVLCVRFLDVPSIPETARLAYQVLPNGFHRLVVSYGFKDTPDIPQALAQAAAQYGLPASPMTTSYFVGRETLIPGRHAPMSRWRQQLFIGMFRNAGSVVSYFNIPPNMVVELGAQIVLSR